MSETYVIPRTEFAQRRSSFELCQWINRKLEEMRATGSFDELYFERSDPRSNLKKLIEEAIPLSRLGLYLSTPGSEVYVTCYADNQGHDGLVEITGFNERRFKVEVTTAEAKDYYFRRQALSRYGHVQLTGTITRRGRDIVCDGDDGMVDADEEEERCIELMLERLRDKVSSRRYDADTAFLVFLTEMRPLSPRSRAELLHRTERFLLETNTKVPGIYFCYTADYSIDRVAGP
jgi:hypothetical protein